jgi:hypothetical protein
VLSKDVKDIREDVKHRRKQEIKDSLMKGEKIDVYAEFREMAAQIKVEAEKQRKAKMGEESIKEDSNEEMKEEMQEAAKPKNSDKVDTNKIVEDHVASSPWLAALAIKDSESSKLVYGAAHAFNKWQKPFMNTCNLLMKKAGDDKITDVAKMIG